MRISDTRDGLSDVTSQKLILPWSCYATGCSAGKYFSQLLTPDTDSEEWPCCWEYQDNTWNKNIFKKLSKNIQRILIETLFKYLRARLSVTFLVTNTSLDSSTKIFIVEISWFMLSLCNFCFLFLVLRKV